MLTQKAFGHLFICEMILDSEVFDPERPKCCEYFRQLNYHIMSLEN